MEDSAVWAVIWLVAAAAFGIGEILIAGSFFLLPFAAGALAACFMVLILLLIIVFPEIALWLPRALMPMTFK